MLSINNVPVDNHAQAIDLVEADAIHLEVVFIQTVPIDLKSLAVLPNSAAPLKISANTDDAAMSTPSSGYSTVTPGGGGQTDDDMCA